MKWKKKNNSSEEISPTHEIVEPKLEEANAEEAKVEEPKLEETNAEEVKVKRTSKPSTKRSSAKK